MNSQSGKPSVSLTLRPAEPNEIRLIKNSWFNSFRRNSKLGRTLRPDLFDKGENTVIEQLITRFPPVIAVFPSVPDEVVGWVCREFTRPVGHFIYVKQAFRRLGIGRTLAYGICEHSHETRTGELLAKQIGSVYNPFTLWGENHG